MKEQILVRGTCKCGICFILPVQGKNKPCMETLVNNLLILEDHKNISKKN
jgi:hypothetical protein